MPEFDPLGLVLEFQNPAVLPEHVQALERALHRWNAELTHDLPHVSVKAKFPLSSAFTEAADLRMICMFALGAPSSMRYF